MSLFKSLFSLDTLDKRLTAPARAPVVTRSEPDPAKPSPRSELPEGAQPSLWKTKEFFLYYLVFLICVPLMFKAVYDVSQRKSFLNVYQSSQSNTIL
jgi:protein-cysteine N-palmitoyltransferase HHAT